jgi:integrase
MGKRKELYRGLFKSDSGVYFVRFRNGGKDRIKSTGKTDWEEAVEEYKKFRADVRLERTVHERMDDILEQLKNMPDAKAREEARRQLLAKLQGAAESKVLIADAWGEWRKGVKKTTEITIAGYEAVWKRFKLWLEAHRQSYQHLGQIATADAKSYSQDLWASRITVTTYKLHLSFLCRVWRELKNEGGLLENVWSDLVKEQMDKEAVSRSVLTADQLATVIQKATGELRDMIRVGLFTGLRLKDVALLDASKFDKAAGKLSLIPFKTRRKGEKARVEIPIRNEGLIKLLNKPSENGFYFPEMAAKYKAMPSDVSRIIQDHLEACGIRTKEPLTEDSRRKRAAVRFGFHSLRYSFVSLCAGNGTPQHVLSSLVGHNTPQMTLLYSKANDSQRSKAIAEMPTIEV